jgi:two-component system sensor histidine kinase KdpD
MNQECRPNPKELLNRILQEEVEAKRTRGMLKIFLGYAAGVGKTYHMLQEAQSLKEACVDVAIALVETHGRPETNALLEGLEQVPRRKVEQRGIVLDEMDLDAVLARHPKVALVDELAHTNASESRHPKRCQDVEELLEAGINVYTTMNVQHIESLNDVIYQITGIRVHETVPDRVVELADEIEVTDLPPDDLLQRLNEGKVYIPPKAELALRRFFRKGNLLSLRELTLRYAAHKVDEDLRSYMERHGILGPWPAGSSLLVAISPSSLSERLVRIGGRMAADLDAEWFVVHVESPKEAPFTEAAKDQLARNMRLAEELGAKVQILSGQKIADTIIGFASKHNVTLIVAGLSGRSRWSELLRGSVIDEFVRHSGSIHVLVVGGPISDKKRPQAKAPEARRIDSLPFFEGFLTVAATAAICWLFQSQLGLINIAMVLLLPIIYSAMTWGRQVGLAISLLAVIVLDVLFVPPQFSLAVSDLNYLPVFAVFIIVGMATSFLADMVRRRGEMASRRERFVSALYSFSRYLIAARNSNELLDYATKEISEAFECEVAILLPDKRGQLQVQAKVGDSISFDERRLGVATWAYQLGQPAGHGTDTLPSATLSYLPLKANEATIGVLGVGMCRQDLFMQPEQRRLLEAFANITALALSRKMPFSTI